MTTGDSWAQHHEETTHAQGFWASYSDLMAGLVLLLAILAAVSAQAAEGRRQELKEVRNRLLPLVDAFEQRHETLERLAKNPVLNGPGTSFNSKTGSLSIGVSEYYVTGATQPSEDLKQRLRELLPVMLQEVCRNESDFFEHIEVSGHADQYAERERSVNISISTGRAREIMLFLLHDPAMSPFHECLFERGAVAGYGDSQLPPECEPSIPYDPQGKCEQARRIEIRIAPRTEYILERLTDVVDDVMGRRSETR